MTKFVALVRQNKICESRDSKYFVGQKVSDILLELGLDNLSMLFIHTPNFAESLESDCFPTDKYPGLLLDKPCENYKRPNFYLEVKPSSDAANVYLKVDVKNQTKHLIPAFSACFDRTLIPTMDVTSFKEKVKRDLFIDVSSYKVYFEGEGEDSINDQMKVEDIIEKAKKKKLILDCVVTDKAAAKLNHRVCVIAEIISTEETYVSDIKTIQIFWEANMRKKNLMPEDQLQIVFKDFYTILASQTYFLNKFKEMGTSYGSCVAETFLSSSPVFKASQLYVSNYAIIVEILNSYLKKPKFVRKMKEISDMIENGRDIFSYLITPVQRMPRYILFLRDLVKDTPPSHPDYELMQLAYDTIEQVTKQFDSVTAHSKKQSELMRMQKQISSKFIFLDKQRELILQLVVTIPITQTKVYKGTIYIFNDLILIVRERKKEDLGVKMVYDSEVGVFSYKYQWPNVNSITIDATKKQYGDKNAIYKLVFTDMNEIDSLLKELDILRQRIKLESTAKYILQWDNIDVKVDMPALIKPKTACTDSDPFIFSNNLIYKLIDGEIMKVGSLQNAQAVCSTSKVIYIYAGDNIYSIEPPSVNCNPLKLNSKLPTLRGVSLQYYNNYLFLFGGKARKGDYSNTLYVIDLKNSTVKKYENMTDAPSPRWNHGAVIYKKDMIIYGGARNVNGVSKSLSDAAILHLDTSKLEWRPFDINLPSRKRHSMLIYGKYVVILGGIKNSTQIVNLVNEEVQTCHELGNYSTELPYSSSAIFPDGDAFVVIGGHDKKNAFAGIFNLQMPSIVKQSFESEGNKKAFAISEGGESISNKFGRSGSVSHFSTKSKHKHRRKHNDSSKSRKHKHKEETVVIQSVPPEMLVSSSSSISNLSDYADEESFSQSNMETEENLALKKAISEQLQIQDQISGQSTEDLTHDSDIKEPLLPPETDENKDKKDKKRKKKKDSEKKEKHKKEKHKSKKIEVPIIPPPEEPPVPKVKNPIPQNPHTKPPVPKQPDVKPPIPKQPDVKSPIPKQPDVKSPIPKQPPVAEATESKEETPTIIKYTDDNKVTAPMMPQYLKDKEKLDKKQEKLDMKERKKEERKEKKASIVPFHNTKNEKEIVLQTANISMETPLLNPYDVSESQQQSPKKCNRKVWILSGAGAVILLAGVAAVLYLFVFKH